MENWIVYVIMAVSGTGALVSGLVCERRSRRLAMLIGCIAVCEGMLFFLGERLGWSVTDCLTTGLLGGLFLAIAGSRIKRHWD